MARPLRSNPITGPSSLLSDGPTLCPATVLSSLRFLPLGVLPWKTSRRSKTTGRSSRRTTGSHVPCKSLTHARAAYMPDTIWAINRHPPDLSRSQAPGPLLMSSTAFRHVICGLLSFAFIGSHLTRSTARLFRNAQHERLLTAAPHGGLWPPPARRPRRTYLHLLHNTASRTDQSFLRPAALSAFVAHVLRATGDRDRGGLFEAEPVLRDETRRHREFARAEVPVRRERRIRSLRKGQMEHSYRDVGEVTERATRDPRRADKRFTMQVHGDVVAREHDDQFGELRATMRDEIRGPSQRHRHQRCRSEEHTSELQSPCNLVCRLLLEKKRVTRKQTTVLKYINSVDSSR